MRNVFIGGLLLLLACTGCGDTGKNGTGPAGMESGTPSNSGNSGMQPGGTSDGGTGGSTGIRVGGGDPTPLFDDRAVLEINLIFTTADWDRLMYIHSNPPKDNMQTKEYVHCGVEFQGVRFPDAACRPKASPELWKEEPKPQFAIRFDHWNEDGRFFGLRRMNLEANQYNAAPVRDRLGMWLMRKAGLQTPRVNHVRMNKNGAYFGLYMNIEQIDKEFIEDHFQIATGNLYSQGRELETNKKLNDTSRLQAMWDLVATEPLTGDHTAFYGKLDSLLDVHTMLRQTAAEVVLPTGDNWSNGSSNYYYYDDPLTKRFVMMPWDLDTFLDYASPPNADIYHFWGIQGAENQPNKTLQLVYQNPAWKKEFEDNLVALRDGPYTELSAQLSAVCDQIRPHVAADPHPVAPVSEMDKDCKSIKDGIAARIAYIKSVLKR